MAVKSQVRRALAYFRGTTVDKITNVYISKRVGDVLHVTYRGPNGRKRMSELDLSKQYMKMFEEKDE